MAPETTSDSSSRPWATVFVAASAVVSFEGAVEGAGLLAEGVEIRDCSVHTGGYVVVFDEGDEETDRLIEQAEEDIATGRTISGQELRRRRSP